MTMLERAAVALMNRQRKSHGLPPIGAEMFDAEETEYAKELSRAVLLAVREPSNEVQRELAHGDYTTTSYGGEHNTFDYLSEDGVAEFSRDLIDAILSEKPEGLSDV